MLKSSKTLLCAIHMHILILFSIFSDINECEGVICQNGGVCLDGINSFYCNCTTGYDGTNCENGKDQTCFLILKLIILDIYE